MKTTVICFATSDEKSEELNKYSNSFGELNLEFKIRIVPKDLLRARIIEELGRPDRSIFVLAFDDDEFEYVTELPLDKLGKWCILVGNADSTHHLRASREAGAFDYVPRNNLDRDFVGLIRRLSKQTVSASAVIGFTGCGGGAGASTVAEMFADYAHSNLGRSVALIDLDILFGRIAADFGINTKSDFNRNFAKLMPPERMKEKFGEKSFAGFEVFASPHNIDLSDTDPHSELPNLLSSMRGIYDLVIVDVPSRFANFSPEILSFMDSINLVFTSDLQGIRNLSNLRKFLSKTSTIDVHIVQNKREDKPNFSEKELIKLLDLQILPSIGLDDFPLGFQHRADLAKLPPLTLTKKLCSSLQHIASENNIFPITDGKKVGIKKRFLRIFSRAR